MTPLAIECHIIHRVIVVLGVQWSVCFQEPFRPSWGKGKVIVHKRDGKPDMLHLLQWGLGSVINHPHQRNQNKTSIRDRKTMQCGQYVFVGYIVRRCTHVTTVTVLRSWIPWLIWNRARSYWMRRQIPGLGTGLIDNITWQHPHNKVQLQKHLRHRIT